MPTPTDVIDIALLAALGYAAFSWGLGAVMLRRMRKDPTAWAAFQQSPRRQQAFDFFTALWPLYLVAEGWIGPKVDRMITNRR